MRLSGQVILVLCEVKDNMGYEAQMQAEIIGLLQLFCSHVPDRETNAWVIEMASDISRGKNGHKIFDSVRRRNLQAIENKDRVRECQYCFEEVCLQSLYNETCPRDPFDFCSPYWVIKNAILLSRAVEISEKEVIDVVTPKS